MARRRRITPTAWITGAFGVVAVAAFALAFLGPKPTPAPDARGVCWRMLGGEQAPRFVSIASDIANLETCAAHLERLYLQAGGEIAGAYQGRFIFIDSQAIRSGSSLEGSRWRIFFGPQREALDAKLRQGGETPRMVLMPAR